MHMSEDPVTDIKNNERKHSKVANLVWVLKSGGIESVSVNNYRHMNQDKVSMDFIIDVNEDTIYDKILADVGSDKIGIFSKNEVKNKRLYKLRKAIRLYRIFKEKRYDVVYNNVSFPSTLMYAVVAKMAGVTKVVTHAHSIPPTDIGRVRLLVNKIQSIFFSGYSDYNIATSEDAGKWIYGNRKYQIVPNGIDFKKFQFSEKEREKVRNQLNVRESEILIGNIGRLSLPKNHLFILELVSKICGNNQNVKLVIVGEGELEGSLKKRAIELNIADKVIFYGYTKNSEALLSAMDIFLFPSLWEGFGIAAVEAQANGLCTLISDKVPQNVQISNTVWRLPLDISKWENLVSEIIDSEKYKRSQKSTVSKSYEIGNVSKMIETIIEGN